MLKRSSVVFFLILILISSGNIRAYDSLPTATLLPSASSAMTDDAMATVFNPAGLGVDRGTNGYYLHTFSGETGGDNAFFISLTGFGFGAEFVDAGAVRFRKYTLSDGVKLSDGMYLGSSYSWFSSADDKYDKLSSWNVGFLCRASSLFSVGLVARNLNHPFFNVSRVDRMYNLSVAFRPSTDRLTFSVDTFLTEGRKVKDAGIVYAVELEPINGIVLRGSYDRDGNSDVRVGINSARFGLGAYSRFDSNREEDGGVFYTRFSSENYRTSFRSGGRILELEANQLDQLQRAKEDGAIDGVILKLNTDDYSFGKVQEMRDSLLDFRKSGKKVACYMELVGDKEYYLASACDRIALNTAGYLSLDGLRSEVTFYQGALEKLGIKAELYRVGRYKSASESFMRDGMSDACRESLNFLLDDLYDQMVGGIAQGRKLSRPEVNRKIGEGPYTAKEALEAGLVDELIYADQVREFAKKIFGNKITRLSGGEYEDREYHEYNWSARPKLAVIYAVGMIAPGKSLFNEETPAFLSIPRIMGSETITNAIREAREDRSIKAIVLRIDSGGGSVFASDLIWRELMLAKKKKPLIVSMGGAAASGGYYIACPADVIVAEPGTVTGSIGVIAGKFSLRGLYDKLGIKKEILKRGGNSDIYTLYDGFTGEQRDILRRQIQETYDDFVGKVAQSRDMATADVEKIAQGRVWTGKQAKDNGLVDELGGLQLALSLAKSRAGLEPDASVEIVTFPKRVSLLRRFILGEISFLPESLNLKPFMDVISSAEGLANDRIFFLVPYIADYE